VTKLPSVSGRQCVRALEKLGFALRRQEGSHMILRRNEPLSQVVVPELAAGNAGARGADVQAVRFDEEAIVTVYGPSALTPVVA